MIKKNGVGIGLMYFLILSLCCSIIFTQDAIGVEPEIYNLRDDWSNDYNPNGLWDLREGENSMVWNPSWKAWASSSSGPYLPQSAKVETDWISDPDGVHYVNRLAGDIWCHSQDNANGAGFGQLNAVWIAPHNGFIDIEGVVWYAHYGENRSNDWTVELDTVRSVDLATGTVSQVNGDDRDHWSTFNSGLIDGKSLTGNYVRAGDEVKLYIIKSAGQIFGSFTGIDMTVTYKKRSFNLLDFAGMAETWLQSSQSGALYDDSWDFIDDDIINIEDFNVIVEGWLLAN